MSAHGAIPPAPASKSRWWLLLLPALAIVLPVVAFELVVRVFVHPSPYGFGTFRGYELPPLTLIPFDHSVRPDPEEPYEGLVVVGARIARGDLFGYRREDADIGYVNEESRRSRNGWWQSNTIGARSRTETPKAIPAGKLRVAVFGDSFAAGTRVPQEQTWTAQLQELRPDVEVVNFGVDGYGMGQALLLERRMRAAIDYDVALYLYVPWHDGWRDVNVIRYLGEGWGSFTPMPRFVLDGPGIRLVPPFYPRGTMVYERDHPVPTPELLAHLRAYDRFYIPYLYEPPAVVSRFVLWKLVAAERGESRRRRLRDEIGGNYDDEAEELTRRIFETAHAEATAAGRNVLVAVLPVTGNLERFAKSPKSRDRWNRLVAGVRARGIDTVDLAPAFAAAPAGDVDAGFDGTHYGPKASAVIARALASALPDRKGKEGGGQAP